MNSGGKLIVNVGDKVRYILDNVEYLGIIIAKTSDKYRVSIIALGKVLDSDGSDIEVL